MLWNWISFLKWKPWSTRALWEYVLVSWGHMYATLSCAQQGQESLLPYPLARRLQGGDLSQGKEQVMNVCALWWHPDASDQAPRIYYPNILQVDGLDGFDIKQSEAFSTSLPISFMWSSLTLHTFSCLFPAIKALRAARNCIAINYICIIRN